MKKFLSIWIGQFLSMLGSGISGFGLSLWVLEKSSDVTSFTMAVLFTYLPGAISAPIAGSFADRKNRKKIIIVTDILDAISKLIVIILLITGNMEIWMIYILNFISSCLATFQGPAFTASIPEIVPKEELTRVNGLMQLNGAIRSMIVPVISTVLYGLVGLKGLFVIDFVSFFFAIGVIFNKTIPQKYQENMDDEKLSFINDFKYSINYILERKGAMSLIVFFSIMNGISNLALTLLGPLVKSANNIKYYGIVNSIIGVAMILGGIISGLLPEMKDKVKAIVLLVFPISIGLLVTGLSSNWMIIALGIFIFFFPVPYMNALLGSFLQSKIESSSLGRISATIQGLMVLITPISIAIAGPLADKIFLPLVDSEGKLDGTFIGNIVGIGPGRGIGLIFVICGIILLIQSIYMISNKAIINLEKNMPDKI